MRGVRFRGDRKAEVCEYDDEPAGPGEVRVRMRTTAICGSDLHLYRQSSAQDGAYYTIPDVAPGHEPVGTVEEVGPGVTSATPGDRVVVHHMYGCGHCSHCVAGAPHHCPAKRIVGRDVHGSYAELVVAPERSLLHLPADLSFLDGVFMACNFGTAFAAAERADIRSGDTVVVTGLGPVGLCCVIAAHGMGARVIAIDPAPERAELARRVGADAVLSGAADAAAEIAELTHGEGPHVTLEVSGAVAAQRQALATTRAQGTVVLLGLGGGELAIDPLRDIVLKDTRLLGSYTYKPADFPRMVAFIRSVRPRFEAIVGGTFPIEEAPAALRIADAGRHGKLLLDWSARPAAVGASTAGAAA